ncbi:hypothetical protein N2152v2_010639 [Parachlorella kessleri]
MKRRLSEDGLTCSTVRGVGFEFLWHISNVAQLLQTKLPVTSEWIEAGGLVCELLLQPYATISHPSGLDTVGLMFSALDGRDGRNLPATVRFQVVNARNPASCSTVDEGRGVLRVGRSTWAAEELISVAALVDSAAGFVVGDRLTIRVEARYL